MLSTKINLNENTLKPKLYLYFGLVSFAIIVLFFVLNDAVMQEIKEIDERVLYAFADTIRHFIQYLFIGDICIALVIVLFPVIQHAYWLKKGHTWQEIREFYEVKHKLKDLRVTLIKIRADFEDEFPLMELSKRDNLYKLTIKKNHWFNREQIEKNIGFFISVFEMQYHKIQENYKEFILYFSSEQIILTYEEFLNDCEKVDKQFIREFLEIGYNDDGVLKWFYELVPHAFIVGTTGSGKSNLIHVIIASILRIGATIIAIDGKVKELAMYKKTYGVSVTNKVEDYLSVMRNVVLRMNERHQEMERQGKTDYTELNLEPVFVILEEISMIFGMLSKDKGKGAESAFQEFERLLMLVARGGRDAGVFLILTTQDPKTTNVSSELRNLLNLRVLLCPVTEITAFDMMFDSKYRNLPNKEKGYTYIRTEFEPFLVQIPLFPMKRKSDKRPQRTSYEEALDDAM